MASKAEANTTSDHEEIRRWAEERGGQPACVKGTGDEGDVGMLRLDFPGYSGEESLQHISWDEWFEKFDERGLALLYQEQTAGGAQSNFNKLVSRETAEAAEGGGKSRSASKRSSGRSSSRGRSAAKKAPAKKAAKSAGHRNGRTTAASKSSSSKKSASAASKRTAAKKTSSRNGAAKKSASSRGGSSNRGSSTRGGSSNRGKSTRKSTRSR